VAVAWLRRFRWWHPFAALAAAAVLTLPYANAGAGLWMSLGRYAEHWRFNEILFAPLAALGGSHSAAVMLGLGIVGMSALALGLARADAITAALVTIVLTLAISPNVLPWYALWLLPVLVLRPHPAALLFTLTAALAYVVYPRWQSGETWYLSWAWRALEYLPCLAVALLHARRHERDSREGSMTRRADEP
jgi:hypothetical protein